jgi:hypothetical protein
MKNQALREKRSQRPQEKESFNLKIKRYIQRYISFLFFICSKTLLFSYYLKY